MAMEMAVGMGLELAMGMTMEIRLGMMQGIGEPACLMQALEQVDEVLLLQAPGAVHLQSPDGLPQLP